MKKLLMFLIAAIIICSQCYADEIQGVQDAVPDGVRDIVGTTSDIDDTQGFFERLITAVKDDMRESSGGVIKKAAEVLAVSMLCALLGVFGGEKTPDYLPLCGCAAITMICVSDINSYIRLGSDTINEISLFSKTLLPAMCTLGAATGEISSAAVKYAASALFSDIFISLAQNIILPCIYAYLAVSIAAAAFNNSSLSGIASLIKWIAKTLMTVLALSFTVYISLSSAIASGGDAVLIKIAKTSISTFLPVVGGIVSDAASSVIAGAQLIRNTVGVFGMITVLSLCASPLVISGLNYLVFKATSAVASAMNTGQIAALTGSIGTAFGMIVGLIGTCGIMMFISIISCIRTVTG